MKKFIILFLLGYGLVAQGAIVNRYSFTDGDTVAVDSVSGRNGTLAGTAVISGNRLVLDGSGAVNLPADILDPGLQSVTIEFWFEINTVTNWQRVFDFGETAADGGGGNTMFYSPTSGAGDSRFAIGTNGPPSWQTGEDVVSGTTIETGTLTHIACVYDGATSQILLYQDGALVGSTVTTMQLSGVARMFAYIGDSVYTADPSLNGSVDEFRIYDTALTSDEIRESFLAGPDVEIITSARARNPKPANEATDVSRDVTLSWAPGPSAQKHDVYFGTNLNDVNNAEVGSLLLVSLNQDANTYDLGRLDFGQTFFWRVDEVNAPPDSTVTKGNVWSFTVEPFTYPIASENIIATASSQLEGQGPENTINGSGLDANDLHSVNTSAMWLSASGEPGSAWIQYEFDKPYKLDEMKVWNYNGNTILVLYGLKDVTIEYSIDGANWTQLDGVPEFAQASGAAGYASNTTVDFGDVAVKYVRITANSNWGGGGIFDKFGLSEVKFMYIPVSARDPNPELGATDVAIDAALSWRAGREAAEHNVNLSIDEQAVIDGSALVDTVQEPGYEAALDLDQTYFWRIDEVNNTETENIWQGSLWSFTTQEYLVVDDFESYNDIPDGQQGSHLVYLVWADGLSDPSNGSTMGYLTGTSLETTIVQSGDQSVPLFYDNTSANFSEVKANTTDLAIGRDWTKGNPGTLVIWFYGDPNNATTEQMYVKVNNAKVVYNGEAADIARPQWKRWKINLAPLGINLSNVATLSIGFERTGGSGGSGMVFIDDIRLYPLLPDLEPVDPGTENLTHSYLFDDGTANDSVGQANGTLIGGAAIVNGAMVTTAQDQWMEMPGNIIAMNTYDEVTIEAWYTPTAGANTSWSMLAYFGDSVGGLGANGYFMTSARGDDKSRAAISIGNTTAPYNSESGADGPEYDDGLLHHMVSTIDATDITLYIDGDLMASTPLSATNKISGISQNYAYLAKGGYTGDPEWIGAIHQFNIYNRALTPAEILFLYQKGVDN
jgi:hypothetical protein